MKHYIQGVNLWLPVLKSSKNMDTIFGNHFLVAWCNVICAKYVVTFKYFAC